MTLKIMGMTEETFPEHGWGVVGEKLGDASTETLGRVLPLEERGAAKEFAAMLDANRLGGKSWLVTPVNLLRIVPCEEGLQQAEYIEASNLVHPGSKNP